MTNISTLIAYIPMDRRHSLARASTQLPNHARGAALFADISGFTPLAERLSAQWGAQRGAEELTRQLNRVYEALIGQVHRYHGSIIGFVGDAITCWFDNDDGMHATACAIALQTVMQQIATTQQPAPALSIKVGIAAGTAHRFRVGDPHIQYIDVLAGDLLNRMSRAEGTARTGEILLDATTAAALADDLTIADWRPHPQRGGRYAIVDTLSTAIATTIAAVAPAPWPDLDSSALPVHTMRPWVLPSVYQRLTSTQSQFLAELRPAVSLFLKFGGLDYDDDPAAGEKLDAYIRWVQHTVDRYAGHLIQLTVGDKGSFLYAAFGAPVAHTDDAERAVQAGLELIAPPAYLNFITPPHIGIALGQARTGAYGSPARRTYGIIGDDAVLAARLMDVAPAGEIRCAYSVYQQTRARVTFEKLLPVRVKGRVELVHVYRPMAIREVPATPPERDGTIIGRQTEIAQLEANLKAAASGESRILIVKGEAGIGKSRLIAALLHRAQTHGLTYLSGSGRSIEQQTPYRAWRDVFTAYFDIGSVTNPATRREKVAAIVKQITPEWQPYLPLLNDVLHLDVPETDLSQTLDPQMRQQTLLLLLNGLLHAWTREQPLILVLDDAHWLDSLSWQLTEQITRSLAASAAPFLCLIATRPMVPHSAGARHLARWQTRARKADNTSHRLTTVTLDLTTLTPAETVKLVTQRLGLPAGSLPTAIAKLVETRAEGHPFFAEELVFALRDQGLITVETVDGQPHCSVSTALTMQRRTLPDTIHGIVLARIDQLLPEQQLTLKVAAIIGRTFTYDLLRATLQQHTPVAEATLKAHLDTLSSLDLTPLEAIHPLTYIFKHIITQETAYQTLLFAQRRDLHASVATAIETQFAGRLEDQAELLAYHWEHGGNIDKAVAYLLRAGERARQAYANDTAIAHFQHVLALLAEYGDAEKHNGAEQIGIEKDYRQFAAWRGLGRTYFAIPDMAQTENCFREAIALGEKLPLDVDERGRLYHWLGEALWWQNRSSDQVEVGLRALSQLSDNPAPSEALALANQTTAVGYIALERMDLFYAYTEHTASFIEQLPYTEELRPAYIHIIVAAQESGDVPKALRWLRVLERRATQYGDLRAVAEGQYQTGKLLAGRGQLQKAISSYQQALNLYTQMRDLKFQVWCLQNLGYTLWQSGQLQAAAKFTDRAIEVATEVGSNKHVIGECHMFIGNVALAQQDFVRAEKHFRSARAIFTAIKSHLHYRNAILQLARTYWAAGERQAALHQFQKAIPKVLVDQYPLDIVGALSGLEATYVRPQAFRAFCKRYHVQYPDATPRTFTQWFLEPAQPCNDFRFATPSRIQNGDWTWINPFDDCAFTTQDRLTLHAANERALWKKNHSAPRLVRSLAGDVILQAVCEPVIHDKPAIGGLVLWQDGENFLRVDRGRFGPREILFSGSLMGQPHAFGRGRLPSADDDRVYLRLERLGARVQALCSVNGEHWFTVGYADFPVTDPIQAGPFASGSIDRAIYLGAHPDGTAIRFTSLQVWATILDTGC